MSTATSLLWSGSHSDTLRCAGGSLDASEFGQARGNPVEIRDYPIAVSGSDRRHESTGHVLPGKRRSVGLPVGARESEDLPLVRASPVRVRSGTSWDWFTRTNATPCTSLRSSRAVPGASVSLACSRGESCEPTALQTTATQLRERTVTELAAAGLDSVPGNTFSFYDHVLDTAAMFDAVPQRFRDLDLSGLDTYFCDGPLPSSPDRLSRPVKA